MLNCPARKKGKQAHFFNPEKNEIDKIFKMQFCNQTE
jgi:hypothetical protein